MTTTVGRRVAAVVLVVAVVPGLAPAPLAAALEPGVHVDPGSPAAKEYALPLNQARQTGQEGPAREGGHGALFGSGISAAPRQARNGSGRTTGGSRAGASARETGAAPPAVAGTLARQGSPREGSDSTLALLGGGVLVLALAAFLGVVLRGRRTADPS